MKHGMHTGDVQEERRLHNTKKGKKRKIRRLEKKGGKKRGKTNYEAEKAHS